MSDEWPQYTWNFKHGAPRTKFSTILSSFLLSSLIWKADAYWRSTLKNVSRGWVVKLNRDCLVVQNPRVQSAVAETDTNNQDSLCSCMTLCKFPMKTSDPCTQIKTCYITLACSAYIVSVSRKNECSTQFSINLPGCNNQKPYLFLFISWNVSRHIHSLFLFLSSVFIKTSPLVVCYLLHFQ